MRVSKELILREVAGENILIPVGKAALKIHGMICLTETAAFLFGKLQEEHTEAMAFPPSICTWQALRSAPARRFPPVS